MKKTIQEWVVLMFQNATLAFWVEVLTIANFMSLSK